jgi:two-component system, chemotaxis family, protein-glutamate methylesterase/glutaminase
LCRTLATRACEMPQRALNYAGADYVLPVREIGPKLIELINLRETSVGDRNEQSQTDREVREHEAAFVPGQGDGRPSVFACPECHGVLWEIKDGNLVRYRCRVGHSYTEGTLQGELGDSAERALWAAMRALEEKAAMTRRMVNAASGPADYLQRLKDQLEADNQNAEIIRKMIFVQG